MEALPETPALVGVAAKGGANAPPQAGFPPWSISFQLGDPTGEWCFLVPRAQTGAPPVDASLRKHIMCPQTNGTTHILVSTLDVFWVPVPHKPFLEGGKITFTAVRTDRLDRTGRIKKSHPKTAPSHRGLSWISAVPTRRTQHKHYWRSVFIW